VVAALAGALCLTDIDRAYLFALTGHPPPRTRPQVPSSERHGSSAEGLPWFRSGKLP